jgi:hypothetical protein
MSNPALDELKLAALNGAFRLEAMARDFGRSNYTDRYGDGPACTERANAIRKALANLNGQHEASQSQPEAAKDALPMVSQVGGD